MESKCWLEKAGKERRYVQEKNMGISEKIAKAKKTDWVTEGIPEAEVKEIVRSAKESVQNIRKDKQLSGGKNGNHTA